MGGIPFYTSEDIMRAIDEDKKSSMTIVDGAQEWWRDGQLHRRHNKPAVVKANGICQWWVLGEFIREEVPMKSANKR